MNASHAGKHSTTKFNSETGRKAAFRKHKLDRERKARAIKESQEGEM